MRNNAQLSSGAGLAYEAERTHVITLVDGGGLHARVDQRRYGQLQRQIVVRSQ